MISERVLQFLEWSETKPKWIEASVYIGVTSGCIAGLTTVLLILWMIFVAVLS